MYILFRSQLHATCIIKFYTRSGTYMTHIPPQTYPHTHTPTPIPPHTYPHTQTNTHKQTRLSLLSFDWCDEPWGGGGVIIISPLYLTIFCYFNLCHFLDVFLQHFCSIFAAFLQHFCSIFAAFFQRFCSFLAAYLQHVYTSLVHSSLMYHYQSYNECSLIKIIL